MEWTCKLSNLHAAYGYNVWVIFGGANAFARAVWTFRYHKSLQGIITTSDSPLTDLEGSTAYNQADREGTCRIDVAREVVFTGQFTIHAKVTCIGVQHVKGFPGLFISMRSAVLR